jgi:hypothetical protein
MAGRLEAATLIPRYQRVLFWLLLAVAVAMSVILIRLRERAQDRLLANADTVPLSTPFQSPGEKVTLLIANDADGSLVPVERTWPLPKEVNARARVLLEKLLAEYADAKSSHPIISGPAVEEVFLMPLPVPAQIPAPGQGQAQNSTQGQMAVVNLSRSFAENHPSGIEPETLTLLSIIGTLHTNLPQITQVRFLIDGQSRETLAGHADLSRVYLAGDSSPEVRP